MPPTPRPPPASSHSALSTSVDLVRIFDPLILCVVLSCVLDLSKFGSKFKLFLLKSHFVGFLTYFLGIFTFSKTDDPNPSDKCVLCSAFSSCIRHYTVTWPRRDRMLPCSSAANEAPQEAPVTSCDQWRRSRRRSGGSRWCAVHVGGHVTPCYTQLTLSLK